RALVRGVRCPLSEHPRPPDLSETRTATAVVAKMSGIRSPPGGDLPGLRRVRQVRPGGELLVEGRPGDPQPPGGLRPVAAAGLQGGRDGRPLESRDLLRQAQALIDEVSARCRGGACTMPPLGGRGALVWCPVAARFRRLRDRAGLPCRALPVA